MGRKWTTALSWGWPGRKYLVGVALDDGVAFAGDIFECRAIDDVDEAAAVPDQAGVLSHATLLGALTGCAKQQWTSQLARGAPTQCFGSYEGHLRRAVGLAICHCGKYPLRAKLDTESGLPSQVLGAKRNIETHLLPIVNLIWIRGVNHLLTLSC